MVSSGQRKRWGGRKCSGTGTGGAGGNRGSEAGTGEKQSGRTCRTCETEVYSETAKSEAAVQKTKIGETPKIPETETPDNVDLKSKKSSFLLSAIPERIRKCIANLKARIHRISQRFKKIARKFRQGKKQWETILTFIRDEENKKAFRLAKRQIFALIRHVLPQKLEGKIHFGFGDPYTTGPGSHLDQPVLWTVWPACSGVPGFMEPCLDGELKLKGRIRLGTLIFLAPGCFRINRPVVGQKMAGS